jgi:hypothetical protein
MSDNKSEFSKSLNLKVGDLVEVRSEAEILSTLDSAGCLDQLPFMPEMLEYCGKQFRVFKRVDKVCDTIVRDGLRRMYDTVLLEGMRCNGAAHGGCQASCTIFWKEAWLKRVAASNRLSRFGKERQVAGGFAQGGCSREALERATRKSTPEGQAGEYYSCQATELRRATHFLHWWDPRQYWRDVRSGNVGITPLVRAFFIWVFNTIQTYRRGGKYPFIEGKLKKTPTANLNLQAGELVELKPKNEILQTLDVNEKNRGLSFDRELVKYCGGTYRVLRRVNRLIDEKTGKMLETKNPCIILDGVTCTGDYNRYCPRDIYHFVREIWLRRIAEPADPQAGPRSEGTRANAEPTGATQSEDAALASK